MELVQPKLDPTLVGSRIIFLWPGMGITVVHCGWLNTVIRSSTILFVLIFFFFGGEGGELFSYYM